MLTPRIGKEFLVLALLVLSSGVMVIAQQRSTQQSDATTVFRSARDLITDGEWAKAQEKFSEYVAAFPNEKNLDAALYWLAYTQQKLARYDQCRATIDRLLEKYPGSTWREDARLLLAQVAGSSTLAYQDLVTTLKGRAAIASNLQDSVIYVPGTALAPVAVTPMPGEAVGIGEGVGLGRGSGTWAVEPSTADDNNDDPCEFKIVVLQALFQTDLQRG